MMENHRTGLLWKLFMSVPEVQGRAARPGLQQPASRGVRAVTAADERARPGVRVLARKDSSAIRRAAMLSSISPLSIVKHRPGFGQTVQPIAGAIVASPVLGAYDPDPDYFFIGSATPPSSSMHCACCYVDRRVGDEALQHLRDFTASAST
jgi:hypothetical protein